MTKILWGFHIFGMNSVIFWYINIGYVNLFCRQFLSAISTFQDKFLNILFLDQQVYFSEKNGNYRMLLLLSTTFNISECIRYETSFKLFDFLVERSSA